MVRRTPAERAVEQAQRSRRMAVKARERAADATAAVKVLDAEAGNLETLAAFHASNPLLPEGWDVENTAAE